MLKKVFFILLFLGILIALPVSMTSHVYAFSSDFFKGANIRPTSSEDFSSASFQQSLKNLAQDGANEVTLVIPWYQTNTTTTTMLKGNDTPSDTSVINAITYAHSLGLKVMIKPHVDPFSGEWRAMINPSDRATWFANYGALLNHYAQIAQQHQVEAMCLGTELYDMTSPKANSSNASYWDTLIQQVKQNFSGKITYDAQYSGVYSELNDVTFWNKMDFIGISGYYPLSGTSVSDYSIGWKQIDTQQVQPLAQKWSKPIWFTEVGYKSISGANTDPGVWQKTGSIDLQGQADLYQALLSYWTDKPYLAGISFWEWTSNPSGGGSASTDYTPQNKPAEAVIKQWYSQNSGSVSLAPASATPYIVTASMNSQNLQVRQQLSIDLSVTPNIALGDGIVDVEIYDNTGSRVLQQFFDHQTIDAGQKKNFTLSFTPLSQGQYTIKTGIFTGDWSHVIFWDDAVNTFSVGSTNAGSSITTPIPTASNAATATPTPTPSQQPTQTPIITSSAIATSSANQSVTLWWPVENTTIVGTQPFKALIQDVPLEQYVMYWQVDGGQLNPMQNNIVDNPHKQADVNVNGWRWRGNGPYLITFIAKDTTGKTLATKSVTISVLH